jgi:photosystem II stability/assembly factor-like uncharacterized protein
MRRSTFTWLFVCVLVAALCAGCDSEPAAAPTPEAPVEISEPLTGTLTINGAVTHPFVVQRAGTVVAQIVTYCGHQPEPRHLERAGLSNHPGERRGHIRRVGRRDRHGVDRR